MQSYPTAEPAWTAPEMEERFTLLDQTIGLVRTSRVLLNYPPGQKITFYLAHEEPQRQDHLDHLRNYLAHLGRGTVELAPATSVADQQPSPIGAQKAYPSALRSQAMLISRKRWIGSSRNSPNRPKRSCDWRESSAIRNLLPRLRLKSLPITSIA